MRSFASFGLLFGLAFFGFGCKQPSYQTDQPTNWRGIIQTSPEKKQERNRPTPPPVDTKPFFDSVTPKPLELPVLRQAMSNLVSAKSFHATLKLPPAEGQETPMQGELVFNRSQGFRGTIQITPQMHSEVLAMGDEVYMRANTSTWQNIGNTVDGKKLQLFFQIAFPDHARPTQVLVSDSARILDVTDDPSGCRRYTYTEVLPKGDLSKTTLCIQDSLPTYIVNEYAEGSTEVHYRDINQPTDIHQQP